jgi:hypothetical protein
VPQHRDLTVQLVDEQKFGNVCVEVLAHRLKNKIATACFALFRYLTGRTAAAMAR